MKINDSGLSLIKSFEGLRLSSYQDQAGIYTIGFGHTGLDVLPNQTITEDVADMFLRQDLSSTELGVTKILNTIGQTLNENQFSALVSVAYNIGVGALSKSSIIKHIDNDDFEAAADTFLEYINVKGVKNAGLLRRRKSERALFLA